MPPEITHHATLNRYEARVEGVLAGIAEYTLGPGVITMTHTEVEPRFEGRGVGSALARTALDDARQHGLMVQPRCHFIAGWIERHPGYADLVA